MWRQKVLLGEGVADAVRVTEKERQLMEEGKRREPFARAYFSRAHGYRVFTTGMWVHPLDQRISASPDGCVVTEHGLVPLEIKSPSNGAHIDLVREHKDTLQLQTQIQCMGAPYGYLYYYYSENDERNRLIWVPSSREQWVEIVALVDDFLGYVNGRQPPAAVYRLSERQSIITRYRHKYAEFTTTLELLYCASPFWRKAAQDRDDRGCNTSASSAVIELKPAAKAANKRGAPQESGAPAERASEAARAAGVCHKRTCTEDSSSGSAGSQRDADADFF
jgi:hypothetical protein